MREKENKVKFIIYSTLKSVLFAVLIALAFGYALGSRPILVNGWSAQPDIRYQSLVITQRVSKESLKVGDYVTFSMTGKSFITHQIISIDLENDVIVCADNQYNRETGEYEHGGTQTIKYNNIVGKVVFKSYLIGKTIFTIREKPWLLVGLFAEIMLLFIVKDKFKVEPGNCERR